MSRVTKFSTTLLRSKVAHRIFVLFLICALIPITALVIISFKHVTKQLNQQSTQRLHQASKAEGMAIYERLTFLNKEMKLVASGLESGSSAIIDTLDEGLGEPLEERFKGLVLLKENGNYTPILGRIQNPPEPTKPEKQQEGFLGARVFSRHYADSPSRIFMSIALDPEDPARGSLIGEINKKYLWGTSDANTLPPMTELFVLDQSNKILLSSIPVPKSFSEQLALKMSSSTKGRFEWKDKEKEYLAGYWTIFLKSGFSASNWMVVLSEPKSYVLAPMADFKKSFPFVILLSLWVVMLLSINQIRKVLVPLKRLKEGTQRIAMRDFNSRVTVSSGDEFEDLASSFNSMAGQLGRQVNALITINEIDTAILSSLETEKIVETVLTHMRDVSPCDCVSVTLLDPDAPDSALIHMKDGNPGSVKLEEVVSLKPEEVRILENNPKSLLITGKESNLPSYIVPMGRSGYRSFLVLPVFLKKKLSCIISLGYLGTPAHDQDELDQARQLTDHVAVALSNARLVKELDQLNWGTLNALARAVDAKSPWTAGHSSRVTQLALKIGRALGLTREELDDLHRAGLLHDIGKIATPLEILDKSEKLTSEEYQIICDHPRKGVSILEPIKAYANILPVALQHHERFDGKGYPDGIIGEAIPLGSRILAVADTFDAITSDRPYRAGLSSERAIEIIKDAAGSQFDPEVVEAFLEVMAQEEEEPENVKASVL